MADKTYDRLGPLQRDVMDLLWVQGEATVAQVHEALTADRDLAYTTVLTVMQKLEKEGWLKRRKAGRSHVYQPARSKSEEGASALRRFVQRVFGGDKKALFAQLLDDTEMTDEELSGLRRLIDEKRQEQRSVEEE